MEKDLNDIELIDKYLSGTLSQPEAELFNQRFLTDDGFKQEVAIYQKIYDGIKKAQRENLKKNLNVFYDEYAGVDDEEAEQELPAADNVRSINPRKNLYIISGIAAAVIIGLMVFLIKFGGDTQNPPGGNLQGHNKPAPGSIKGNDTATRDSTPHIAEHKKPHADKPQQQRPGNGNQAIEQPKGAYALVNEVPLPAESIRRGTYPEDLTYTFNEGQLTIYGDPLMAMLYLNLYKHGKNYYASIDGTVYRIEQTATRKGLVEEENIQLSGASKPSESVTLVVAPMQTTVYNKPPFGVMLVKGGNQNQYSFTKDKNGNKLILQGDFSVSDTKVVSVKKESGINWYVVKGTEVYAITQFGNALTGMKELSAEHPSEEARMFFGREGFKKPVSVF